MQLNGWNGMLGAKQRISMAVVSGWMLLAVPLASQAQDVAGDESSRWVQIALHSEAARDLPELVIKQIREGASQLTSDPNAANAERMVELMNELLAQDRSDIAHHLGLAVFHSESPAEFRRRAFGVVYRDRPNLLSGDVREVVIRVPNVTCHGRFLDSLREHIRDSNPWVYAVSVELLPEPYRKTGGDQHLTIVNADWPIPSTLRGRDTKITFVIDAKQSAQELASVLVGSRRYDMKNWQIQQFVPMQQLLPQSRD